MVTLLLLKTNSQNDNYQQFVYEPSFNSFENTQYSSLFEIENMNNNVTVDYKT